MAHRFFSAVNWKDVYEKKVKILPFCKNCADSQIWTYPPEEPFFGEIHAFVVLDLGDLVV